MTSKKNNKTETVVNPNSTPIQIVSLPVSTQHSSFFNIKELTKQYNQFIQDATKAITSLESVSSESVSTALITAYEATYSHSLGQMGNFNSKGKNKKGKRNKRSKDPNAPKKPLSNYMVYCMRFRSDVKEKNPNSKPTEISQILGQQWNKLTKEQKEKYIDTTFNY
jgi:hypothetical protein